MRGWVWEERQTPSQVELQGIKADLILPRPWLGFPLMAYFTYQLWNLGRGYLYRPQFPHL